VLVSQISALSFCQLEDNTDGFLVERSDLGIVSFGELLRTTRFHVFHVKVGRPHRPSSPGDVTNR